MRWTSARASSGSWFGKSLPMENGILCSDTAFLANTLNAAVIVSPTSLQKASNSVLLPRKNDAT